MIETMSSSLATQHVLEVHPGSVELERLVNEAYLLCRDTGYLPGLSNEKASSLRDVLEIQCGPGVWSSEMAQTYPDWQVVAIDDRPLMITHAQAQSRQVDNLRYCFARLDRPLPFADASFDLVAAQFLSKALKREQWPFLLRESLRILRPGGRLQLTEYEIGTSNAPAHSEFLSLYAQAVALAGGSFSGGGQLGYSQALPALLEETGFASATRRERQLNYSSGDGEEGYKKDFRLIAPAVQRLIAQMGLRTDEELHSLHQRQLQEMRSPFFQASISAVMVYGLKP